jgi:O-antigen ligase
MKYFAITIILAGLLLTFSRSSIVSLAMSIAIFSLYRYWRWFFRPTIGGLKNGVTYVLIVGVLIAGFSQAFPITFDFFGERLFTRYLETGAAAEAASDAETSEGTRIFIWQSILKFVAANPFTGAGYLGVWTLQLFGDPSGSAHNQYFDVLFRTGLIGFLIYIYFLYRVGNYLLRKDQGLFWGFVSILIYGMFHETFKESHGGFILAFLIGMLVQGSLNSDSQRSLGIREASPAGKKENIEINEISTIKNRNRR